MRTILKAKDLESHTNSGHYSPTHYKHEGRWYEVNGAVNKHIIERLGPGALDTELEDIEKFQDEWKHKFIFVEKDDWIYYASLAARCTSPGGGSCDDCPGQCTKDGVPVYSSGIRGDGTVREDGTKKVKA